MALIPSLGILGQESRRIRHLQRRKGRSVCMVTALTGELAAMVKARG